MKVELITPEALNIISTWWEARGDGSMPADILPTIGVCAVDDDGPCAAAWIYQPRGCRVAIMDWLVVRPECGPIYSRDACRSVIEKLNDIAKEGGAKTMFASVSRKAMMREAVAVGFQVAETNCIHLVKEL